MTLAIDTSTPASTTALTTASFSPPANSLLVALYGNYFNRTITGIANTGTALTWNSLKAVSGANGGDESAQIWTAVNASAQTGITATVSLTGGNSGTGIFAVFVLTSASSTQNGATNTAQALSGSPSVAVTTTAAGSIVFMLVCGRGLAAPTPASGQTDTFNSVTYTQNPNGQQWVQWTSPDVASSGTNVTMSSSTGGAEYLAVVAEILAGGAAAAHSLVLPNCYSRNTLLRM